MGIVSLAFCFFFVLFFPGERDMIMATIAYAHQWEN